MTHHTYAHRVLRDDLPEVSGHSWVEMRGSGDAVFMQAPDSLAHGIIAAFDDHSDGAMIKRKGGDA